MKNGIWVRRCAIWKFLSLVDLDFSLLGLYNYSCLNKKKTVIELIIFCRRWHFSGKPLAKHWTKAVWPDQMWPWSYYGIIKFAALWFIGKMMIFFLLGNQKALKTAIRPEESLM